MICDAATKPGETCHPLRAYGYYTENPDESFDHKDRNFHGWPPHKNSGHPPLGRLNCTSWGGTWASHLVYDRSSRTVGDARKIPLPNACMAAPYEGIFATPTGPNEKNDCRAQGGAWTKIDPAPSTCGTKCQYECRMPCCLGIYEDGPPIYKGERAVDQYPGGTNDLIGNMMEPEPAEDDDGNQVSIVNLPYEFLGRRPVCSRANPCEPKFSCLGGDVCLEGYVKYYEPYVQKDGEYVCQNFHYKLPGKCPSPIVTWGPIQGFTEFDKDFLKSDIPHQHAYLVTMAESSADRRLMNSTGARNTYEGTFEFQSINANSPDYRASWCDDEDTDQHCFWGSPVKVLGFAADSYDTPTLINPDQWIEVSKKKIKSMNFQVNKTKNSLLDASRILKAIDPEAPAMVKIQMYDQTIKIVPTKDLIMIRYPSLRLSGVPDSIDPDGGNAGWCLEHPARCYWERNPHPKGDRDSQNKIRPQAQMCCFAPKCTECDPSTHFRMEENCQACPKCWWCIPLAALGIAIFGSIAMHFLMKMRLNFVIISLALDHMQILGLLAGAKINWPWQLKIVLKWFVFFQLDIDVAGPECLARGIVTFENKWWFKVLVPFIGMILVLTYKIVSLCCGACCGICCGKKQKHKTVAQLVAKGKNTDMKPTKKKSHVWEDMAKNGQSTKTITFMVKAFINIVAFCCTLLCSFVVVVYFIYRY